MSTQNGRPQHLLGYTIDGQRRIIVAQRINGLVCVGDLPADGHGKRYLLGRGLTTCGELDALIADYTAQVSKRKAIPASASLDVLTDLAA